MYLQNAGPNMEPIATPSVVYSLKCISFEVYQYLKSTFLVQSKRSSLICSLGMLVFPSFWSIIVKSNETFVNKEVTWKNISLKLFGIFCPLRWVMNSFVLLTVYSDVLRSDKSLAKYFVNSYDAVLMLEIIGRIGISSTALSFFNLCVLTCWV